MPSLADRPEIIGFFSYSRDDDRDSEGALSLLRRRIQNELRGLLGRSELTLRLFQDAEAIASGTFWEQQIGTAIDQSVFFVPIVTPRVVRSEHCRAEFAKFLGRECVLGRNDLVFPIVYIEVSELQDERAWRGHPVLQHIGARQYVDWCDYRFEPADSPDFRRAIAMFARTIAMALRRDVASLAQRPHEPDALQAAREGSVGSAGSAILGERGAIQSDEERRSLPTASGPEMPDSARPRADRDVTQAHPSSIEGSTEKRLLPRDPEQKDGTAAPVSFSEPTATGAPSSASHSTSYTLNRFLPKVFAAPEMPFSISIIQTAYYIYMIAIGPTKDKAIFLPLFVPQFFAFIIMYSMLRLSLSFNKWIYVGYSLISIIPLIFFLYLLSTSNMNSLLLTGSLLYAYCALWGVVSALTKFSIKS